MQVSAYPLQWPTQWPRTRHPQRALFQTSPEGARAGLLAELERMGVRPHEAVISSNAMLRQDGYPYANQPRIDDAGVAVYFVRDGNSMCIPCDKWNLVHHNMQAIRKSIEALRGLERWGAKHMVDAAFAGFTALPAGAPSHWSDVLQVRPGANASEVEQAYRRLVKQLHPDTPSGDPVAFRRVQEAYEQWKRERGLTTRREVA